MFKGFVQLSADFFFCLPSSTIWIFRSKVCHLAPSNSQTATKTANPVILEGELMLKQHFLDFQLSDQMTNRQFVGVSLFLKRLMTTKPAAAGVSSPSSSRVTWHHVCLQENRRSDAARRSTLVPDSHLSPHHLTNQWEQLRNTPPAKMSGANQPRPGHIIWCFFSMCFSGSSWVWKLFPQSLACKLCYKNSVTQK